ncbi:MAG TPA: ABC transporter permease [Xanthobacteraceae bacterium]|jgi:cell division transport system permease protein|nr:ABC transporter permease [Xanthobacteraceae bacterium]
MSMIDPADVLAEAGPDPMPEPWDNRRTATMSLPLRPAQSTIVPGDSLTGRSLAAVVAIMTFLAALTTGAVIMVVNAATDWQSDVGREVTIQVRPVSGRNIENDVNAAVAIARASNGIADVRAYTKEESEKLVEPWLGSGLALGDLPIPRMIVIKLAPGPAPDFVGLRKTLATQVPSATLDDHRGWIDRMRTMATAAVAAGLGILVLVVAVTILSVTFATRGAMATNRPIVEVLHYVGATDGFIAGQFQRHFLMLGLKGGLIGGGGALLLFGIITAVDAWLAGTASGDEAAALFGNPSIGLAGFGAIFGQILLMAAVTALTSRHTVNETLKSID